MQCHGYLPVYHSHCDLNMDPNGGSRPMYNGNGAFRSGHFNNHESTLPVPQANFGRMELVRETMIVHEATFRDQVQELHRLYRKQRELMTEVKSKGLYVNHLQLEVQSSNSSSAILSSSVQDNNIHSLPCFSSQHRPNYVNIDYVQRAFNCIKVTTPEIPVVSQNDGPVNKYQISKGKKVGGKLLDLELPAEAYIDSDEWESLRDAQFVEYPTSAILTSSKRSKFVFQADGVPARVITQKDPILQKDVPSPCLVQGTNSNIVDMNDPPSTICLEKSHMLPEIRGTPEISEMNDGFLCHRNANSGVTSFGRIMTSLSLFDETTSVVHISSSDKKPVVVQALPSFKHQSHSNKNVKERADADSRCSPNFDTPASLQSRRSESKLESVACMSFITSNHFKFVNGSCSIDLNSTIFETIVSEKQNGRSSFDSMDYKSMRKTKRCRVIDINLPCDPTTDDEAFTEDVLAGHDYKDSGQIDLNICIMDDELPAKSSSLDKNGIETSLEAPPSPEVEERAPPRGDTLGERAQIAAEAIVSMSCKTLLFSETKDEQNCEYSDSCGLEWFAEIVYSFSTELDNDVGTLRLTEIDDFELMTLNLTEVKQEEYICRNSVEISNQTCSLLLTGKTRKGRMIRSKRKDFQREILPALTSLSRVEVTEDIQILEGLMVDAGTPWQFRTKRTCRTGRKPRAIKKQTLSSTNMVEVKGEFIMSWGRNNRQLRGHRSPASPAVIISRWLEFAA